MTASHASSRGFSATFTRIIVPAAVVVIALLWTTPTMGTFITSFREPAAIRTSGWWTVFMPPFDFTQYTLSNYRNVIFADGMGTAFLNSLIVSIPATAIPITIAAFAAYAFAWMEFPGRDLFFAILVGLLVVPLQMTLIPLLRLYNNNSLTSTFLGIWLAHAAFGLPMATYLLYNYISQLPRDLFESAAIDGASPFTTFVRLVLPLSVPALASFAIFQFLWVWNDLLVNLSFLGVSKQTIVLTVRLTQLVGSKGQDWHLLTAGAFISMFVPLVVFLSLQRYFVRGLLAGSVKG
jgi:alpha-glucoside transport system permease protein